MVEGPRDAWARVAELIVERRDELGLSRPQAITLTAGKVSESTWGAVERVEQTRYGRRKLVPICRALGWADDSIELILGGQEPVTAEPEHDPTITARLDRMDREVAQTRAEVGEIREGLAELLRRMRDDTPAG